MDTHARDGTHSGQAFMEWGQVAGVMWTPFAPVGAESIYYFPSQTNGWAPWSWMDDVSSIGPKAFDVGASNHGCGVFIPISV